MMVATISMNWNQDLSTSSNFIINANVLRPLHSRGLFLYNEITQTSVVSNQYDIGLFSCVHRVDAYQLSQNSTTLSCTANRDGEWLVNQDRADG